MDNSRERGYVEAIQNGDPAPYAFIVNEYQHMAYTIALRVLGNAEDAEDIAQESFIKAYQQINQFQFKSKFSTWLYTIVYRTAISKLKEGRLNIFSISDEENEHYTIGSSQLNQLEVKEEQEFVKRAILNLPGTEALIITLFYLNENSVKEIQEITGLSSALIKIRLFRGRKKLERALRGLNEK
ncbi:MAG: sigma-70 family RNA polymerase sigma factor [Bacteroidota bacterium]